MEWSLDNNFVSEQGRRDVTRDHTCILAVTVGGHYFENQLGETANHDAAWREITLPVAIP